MPAYKDDKTGKWYASFYARDYTGENKCKRKRGFTTKKAALEWERNFKQTQEGDLEMQFGEFVKLYHENVRPKLKHNSWLTKKNITDTKILPYFSNKQINKIKPADIIKWQNEIIGYRNEKGKGYSSDYLKKIHNQISAIFNHAVRM
ncbi:MAG: Arm DNA-binding domain-containing protein, partial [Clostridia bacterium]